MEWMSNFLIVEKQSQNEKANTGLRLYDVFEITITCFYITRVF